MRKFITPEIETQFINAYDKVMQKWPVAYEELYIPTSFGKTHIITSGQKNATSLILINPGGGSATIWYRNAEPLSSLYRIYAVDVIGEMNKSIPTCPIRNSTEFDKWVTELFNGLRINRANVAGNSNGGFFALKIALDMPERVNKVVLISPAATFAQMWNWWFNLLIPAHIIAPVIHSERMVHKAYEWLWQGFPRDEDFARLRYISNVAGYPRYRPSINKIVPYVFSDAELKKITTPVLLLIGDHEVIYSPERVIRRAKQLIPGLRAEIIPNANHSAQYTAADIVNQKIIEFLAD
jgi:pimeloyl-ACP methyl ester carboxylesterase